MESKVVLYEKQNEPYNKIKAELEKVTGKDYKVSIVNSVSYYTRPSGDKIERREQKIEISVDGKNKDIKSVSIGDNKEDFKQRYPYMYKAIENKKAREELENKKKEQDLQENNLVISQQDSSRQAMFDDCFGNMISMAMGLLNNISNL